MSTTTTKVTTPASSQNTSKPRILIVDDNHDASRTLSMLLDLVGYQTFIASDGHQAVDLAGEVRPEVVLMDIGLPGLNGYDACRKIREQPWGTAMSVIAVTGWAVDHDQPRSEAAGFDHYLLKPVDFDELRSVLAELAQ